MAPPIKHGESRRGKYTPEYRAWAALRNRCLNPRNPGFKNYGGRGIILCDRWQSFDAFLSDMGRRPGPGYSIDRIDNSLGYSPENCRWTTQREQNLNRRSSLNFMVAGKHRTLLELCREFGGSYSAARRRLSWGDPVEFAVMPWDLYKVLKS